MEKTKSGCHGRCVISNCGGMLMANIEILSNPGNHKHDPDITFHDEKSFR